MIQQKLGKKGTRTKKAKAKKGRAQKANVEMPTTGTPIKDALVDPLVIEARNYAQLHPEEYLTDVDEADCTMSPSELEAMTDQVSEYSEWPPEDRVTRYVFLKKFEAATMADLRFIRKTLKAVHGKKLQTTVHLMEINWRNHGQLEHMMVRVAQRNVLRMLATKGPLRKGAH